MDLTLSVVIAAYNESENLSAVLREVHTTFTTSLSNTSSSFEIILVDDGSTDSTAVLASQLVATIPSLRYVAHTTNAGKSQAMLTGARLAQSPVLVFMDADGQNPASDALALGLKLASGSTGDDIALVAGVRRSRQDTARKAVCSRAANKIRRAALRDSCRDSGCGLKAIRTHVFLRLPFFDNLHRFVPALVRREGYAYLELDVGDRARLAGSSKYGNLSRALQSCPDLLGVCWLCRRRRSPGLLRAPAKEYCPSDSASDAS